MAYLYERWKEDNVGGGLGVAVLLIHSSAVVTKLPDSNMADSSTLIDRSPSSASEYATRKVKQPVGRSGWFSYS
jgi:hypothetical protein